MALGYYNRYNLFYINGEQTVVPYVPLPTKPSDKVAVYKVGVSRLDKISQEYYGTPTFGWLILTANPTIGSVEFEIPDNSFIRIPYPLISSLQDYKRSVELYNLYYGEE